MRLLIEIAAIGQGLYYFVGALVVLCGFVMFSREVIKEIFNQKRHNDSKTVIESIDPQDGALEGLPTPEQRALPSPPPQLPPGPIERNPDA